MKYRIWCHKRNKWWKQYRAGYTDEQTNAGLYDLQEAIDICVKAGITGGIPQESMFPLRGSKPKTQAKKYHVPQIELIHMIGSFIADKNPDIRVSPDVFNMIIRCADQIKDAIESETE